MRLFKRHTADTSPQLVSAVPISQDVAATNNAESNASDRLEKKSKTDDRLEGILPVKEDIDPPKEPMDSSILIRKGRNAITATCAYYICVQHSYLYCFALIRNK